MPQAISGNDDRNFRLGLRADEEKAVFSEGEYGAYPATSADAEDASLEEY